MWWGIWLIAMSVSGAWITIVGAAPHHVPAAAGERGDADRACLRSESRVPSVPEADFGVRSLATEGLGRCEKRNP